jgi:hypothetical protein
MGAIRIVLDLFVAIFGPISKNISATQRLCVEFLFVKVFYPPFVSLYEDSIFFELIFFS